MANEKEAVLPVPDWDCAIRFWGLEPKQMETVKKSLGIKALDLNYKLLYDADWSLCNALNAIKKKIVDLMSFDH